MNHRFFLLPASLVLCLIASCGPGSLASSPDLAALGDASVGDAASIDAAFDAAGDAAKDAAPAIDLATTDSVQQASCERLCARDETCMVDMSDFCSPACARSIGRFRAPAAEAFIQCIERGGCGTDIGGCIKQAAADAGRRATDDKYEASCRARRVECQSGFSLDYCVYSTLYDDATIAALSTCLASACGDVAACLRANIGG